MHLTKYSWLILLEVYLTENYVKSFLTTTSNKLWNSDIDECSEGLHDCHGDATCVDTFGDFDCICKPGFHGDGINKCLGIFFLFFVNV